MACMVGASSLFGATAGAASKPPSARDASAFNHEISAAETIPCGTDGSVRRRQRRQHSQLRAPDLHKLAIKVKIDRSGAALWPAPSALTCILSGSKREIGFRWRRQPDGAGAVSRGRAGEAENLLHHHLSGPAAAPASSSATAQPPSKRSATSSAAASRAADPGRRAQADVAVSVKTMDDKVTCGRADLLQHPAAIMKPATDSGAFLISLNAARRISPGRSTNGTSYQNDQNHEVLGKIRKDKGLKRVFIMVRTFRPGRTARRLQALFQGDVVDSSTCSTSSTIRPSSPRSRR
jgi:hypothetical protein